jgi:uncharacterized protein (DUF433 family)
LLTFAVKFLKMDANLLQRITINPAQCGGRPCIRGMRIRVTDVLDLLANGLSPEDIVSEELPDLTLDDIRACLAYASLKLNHPVLAAAA